MENHSSLWKEPPAVNFWPSVSQRDTGGQTWLPHGWSSDVI
jgi:hypothetical protein